MNAPSILAGVRRLLHEKLPPGWRGSETTVTDSRKIISQAIRLPKAVDLLQAVSDSAGKAQRSPSDQLWCFRQARFISAQQPDSSKRPEKRLEKAVVGNCNSTGLGVDWGNQIATASGLSKNKGDSRRNIDLVNKSGKSHYRFIELKVRRGTSTPLSAGIELLEYVLLYVWVRQNIRELMDDKTLPDVDASQALLGARTIGLEVLAPNTYYDGYDEDHMEYLQKELQRTCSALGEQAGIAMQFRYKTLVDFSPTQFPASPSSEWLAERFSNPPDHY